MVNIGIIGYGYWGPNIVRNFMGTDGARVVSICDNSDGALNRARKAYPDVEAVRGYNEVLTSKDIDAVAIITPVSTHFNLAKTALENGKHVFVEKPFTRSTAEAEELINLADKKGLKIMVDHTFIFTDAVRKIKSITDEDRLGHLYYYDSMRVNLGMFQNDVNVIWDLAPHDFAIMDFLLNEKPSAVSASGKAHVNGKEDTAYVTVYFTNNMIAHFNVNWLSPVKRRTVLIGGEKRMLVWNDLEADEKIKIYDKGVEVKDKEGVYARLVSYRSGDISVPRINQVEALKVETEYFVGCVCGNKTPINDGHAGRRVVQLLEACDQSLKENGKMVNI